MMEKTEESIHTKIDDLPSQANQRGDDNEQQLSKALQRHEQSNIPAFLNLKERKLVQEHLVKELSQGFEHRRDALNMVLETRLHSIREACNHVLVTGKTRLRQERIQYFSEACNQVESSVNNLASEFLSDMDERFTNLDNYQSDAIRERERIRLEKAVDDFLTTLDQLTEEFRNIISENINGERGNHYG